jgi:phosphatidate cytidylyltransferase
MAQNIAFGWDAMSRGLAWTLTVIVATWVGDSAAYLTGRALGRHKLAPALSPNKTIEGALGGLAGSIAVSGIAFVAFGLGLWWAGVVAGSAIGLTGQLGDLVESFFKRQAGVKDSGDFIPGHGGVLDRIDALLFAFPVGLILAAGFERFGLITP